MTAMQESIDFIKTQGDKCVYCGICSSVCPTYRLTKREGESPRGRVIAMHQVATGALKASQVFVKNIHHCLQCGRCDAICPAHIPITQMVAHTKAKHLHKPIKKYLWAAKNSHRLQRWFALGGKFNPQFRIPTAMQAKNTTTHKHLKPTAKAPLALFTGCTGNTFDKDTKQACLSLFHKRNIPISIPKGQRCCGSLHQHLGQEREAASLQLQNLQAITQHGVTQYLYFLTGCSQGIEALAKQANIPASDILAYLAGLDWSLQHFKPLKTKVLLHLPCSAKPKSKQHIETLLALIPELSWQWLEDAGPCCGSAGSHMVQFPERADALRSPFVAAINQHADTADKVWVLTTNIGCRLHLSRGALADNVTIQHPVTLLDQQLA